MITLMNYCQLFVFCQFWHLNLQYIYMCICITQTCTCKLITTDVPNNTGHTTLQLYTYKAVADTSALVSFSIDYSDDEAGHMAHPVDGNGGFDAMEARFEGVFKTDADQMEVGSVWGGADPYQGVEPMGEYYQETYMYMCVCLHIDTYT